MLRPTNRRAPGDPDPKAVHNERIKTTAGYLNAAAGTSLGAGVIAPLATRVFGVSGPGGPVAPLTLTLGVLIFLLVSLGLQLRAPLGRPLRPERIAAMTYLDLLAFVITPLTVLAMGWGLAWWATRDTREHRTPAE